MKVDHVRAECPVSVTSWSLGPLHVRRMRIYLPKNDQYSLLYWWFELGPWGLGVHLPAAITNRDGA